MAFAVGKYIIMTMNLKVIFTVWHSLMIVTREVVMKKFSESAMSTKTRKTDNF